MESLQIKKYGFFIAVGVGVAEPGVHGIAARWEFQFGDGLAEGAVGNAVLGAEFDDGAGTQHLDESHGEGHVFGPAGFFVHALWGTVEKLPIERVEVRGHGSILPSLGEWR